MTKKKGNKYCKSQQLSYNYNVLDYSCVESFVNYIFNWHTFISMSVDRVNRKQVIMQCLNFFIFLVASQMCVSGHISGDSVMFDFAPFESAGTPSCSCTIYIVAGSRLEFNYVYSPGYYGCGSTITIRHQTTSTIRCLQGAESLTVTPGDSVTVQITRERDAFDSKYCYLLRACKLPL